MKYFIIILSSMFFVSLTCSAATQQIQIHNSDFSDRIYNITDNNDPNGAANAHAGRLGPGEQGQENLVLDSGGNYYVTWTSWNQDPNDPSAKLNCEVQTLNSSSIPIEIYILNPDQSNVCP